MEERKATYTKAYAKLRDIYWAEDVGMFDILATTKCSELGDLTMEQAYKLYIEARSWAGEEIED